MPTLDELRAKAEVGPPIPDPPYVDFNEPPPPRDPVWGKAAERGALTLLTGRRGTGKTFLYTGLAAAMATDSAEYLGYPLVRPGLKILVVDEENPRYVSQARYRALGVLDTERVRYYNRNGVRIGEKRWNEWLTGAIEDFHPDLVVIDGLIAATNISDINDQTQARNVYDYLKQTAEKYGLSVMVLHHEKKRQANSPYDRSEAAMGAISFINLADIHLATELPADPDELALVKFDREDEDGSRTLHTEPTLYWLRLRDDIEPEPETFVIESIKQEDILTQLTIKAGVLAPTSAERKDNVQLAKLKDLEAEGFIVGQVYSTSEFRSKFSLNEHSWYKLRDAALAAGRLKEAGHGKWEVLEGVDAPPV